MKFIIASHGKYAEGLFSAAEQLIGVNDDIFIINAYIDDETLESKAEKIFEMFENEEWIIFTDLLGGSVNQYMMQNLKERNVKVITGINLCLVLEILQKSNEGLNDEDIEEIIQLSKEQMIYMNNYMEEKLKA